MLKNLFYIDPKKMIEIESNKTIFSSIDYSLYDLILDIKSFSMNIYYFFTMKKTSFNSIQKIIDENGVDEELYDKISNSKSFKEHFELVNTNKYLKETYAKSEKVLDNNLKLSSWFRKYNSGCCWFNSKLSHCMNINRMENKILININALVEKVEPISTELTLFHGFERLSNYEIKDNKINMKGFLSKSLSFKIARKFAQRENYFQPKYLVVHYPPESKQVSPTDRFRNEEYEYLTHSNETLEITGTLRYLDFPILHTFYFCKPS